MPLILLCGTPRSGKSTRGNELVDHFERNHPDRKCVLVSDENKLAECGPNMIYANAAQEKELRSWLKSQVQRHLSCSETIVILDAANYIKGYRYELYCLSKLFKTTQLVIECLAPAALTSNNGDHRRAYSELMIEELIARFEKPNASNRWDQPLIRVEFRQQLPFEEIDAALLKGTTLKPNQSTQSLPMTTDNFLFKLDSQTQLVIKQIQSALQNNQLRSIRIPDCDLQINLNRKIPIAELNKLRRQFINYNKMNPSNKESIQRAFVQFINNIN